MVKVSYLGHACFLLENAGKAIIVDPFLTGNPVATMKPEDVKADLILVTHGHGDHLGDAVVLSKRLGVPVYTTFELSLKLETDGAKTVGGNHGGTHDFGFARVTTTWAVHSSSYGDKLDAAGNPCGFVIRFGGKTFYHAGDTDVFYDMKTIGDRFSPDVAMLPIGGFYTMDTEGALLALDYLRPKKVIPMHYNTFPVIKADPFYFKKQAESRTGVSCLIMRPGDTAEV